MRRRRHFGVLLTALVTFLVAIGLIEYLEQYLPEFLVSGAMVALFLMVLTSSVANVTREKRGRAVAFLYCLVGLGTVAHVLAGFLKSDVFTATYHLTAIVCLGYAVILVLSALLRAQVVDFEAIAAAICVYLLMGIGWAYAYSFIEIVEPGSFIGLLTDAEDLSMRLESGNGLSALYFSLVTITTLGYGDIAPVGTAARMSAFMEAIVGQVYLVVLVARLVGLNVAQSIQEKTE